MTPLLFAGPVFSEDDTPYILFYFASILLPLVLFITAVILVVRDIKQKKRHTSTLIVVGACILLYIATNFLFAGSI